MDTNADQLCRLYFQNVEKNVRKNGIDGPWIEKVSDKFCQFNNGRYYLKDTAFKPTGLAFGCPLPNNQFKRRLWRMARLAENTFSRLIEQDEKVFAYVPADWYHITLLNRTHFEESKEIESLTAEEQRAAAGIIHQAIKAPVVLNVNGLLLTRNGALIVPAFPFDNQIFDLRSSIVKEIPALGVHVPAGAHIKIGNILRNIDMDKLSHLLHSIFILGNHISDRLEFSDIYSPLGRILMD
jgi:hypothetical protein